MPIKVERRKRVKGRRVLIVDDEADIRELLDMTLVRMGLDVDCAGSVAEAREMLGTQCYQLCLTDMRLPDGSGLNLVRHISETAISLPVAVITAHGNTENAVAALKAGAFDYIAKPIALEQLRNLVKFALDLPEKMPALDVAAETGLLGSSPAITQVRTLIGRVARSRRLCTSRESRAAARNWRRN